MARLQLTQIYRAVRLISLKLYVVRNIHQAELAPQALRPTTASAFGLRAVTYSVHFMRVQPADPHQPPKPTIKHSRVVLHQLQLQGETLRGRVTRLEEEVAFSKESSAKILVDARGQMECVRAENDKVKAAFQYLASLLHPVRT